MTNTEYLRLLAVKNLQRGLLTKDETDFIEAIKNLDKKELSKLTGSRYRLLKKLAYKNKLK